MRVEPAEKEEEEYKIEGQYKEVESAQAIQELQKGGESRMGKKTVERGNKHVNETRKNVEPGIKGYGGNKDGPGRSGREGR